MGRSKRAGKDKSDKAALSEAESIESSVRLAERIAREAGIDAAGWPTKRALLENARAADAQEIPGAMPAVPEPAADDLAAEVASIEFSVRLAERIAREAVFEGRPLKEPFLGMPEAPENPVWPRLKGRTAGEMRREAKYQMYYVYEHYPEELKSLALQVIARGCPELDEKGAKNFVNKVWANKALQENLQGALNATYYRELFEAEEEQRNLHRTVPEIYLDGDNPRFIFSRLRTFLFKNLELPNRIYLVRSRKGYNKPLPKQLYELFEAEKSRAARRMRNRQRFYR
ncbi:hypothetical protein [Methanocella arvoryzae]|nr:hypothetical protein [Methanocella arvoryzae]